MFLATPHPAPEQPYATFLISGEQLTPVRFQHVDDTQELSGARSDNMEVDSQVVAEEDVEPKGCDTVPTTTMLLVTQEELEST